MLMHLELPEKYLVIYFTKKVLKIKSHPVYFDILKKFQTLKIHKITVYFGI